ncbi:MAG: hypothetical protein A2X86_09160 [Bdellovibrionales bacterium GWA2_49_15]|nr:MAG: hypothetical protein A2X86_09160 [Bdellovibrionales bacterium GWA2_49_15]HAZ12946.1 hypothetical protein [Bdellovibrionales bacterium]
MEVIITEWGLQSYISLKGQAVFSDSDYKSKLRPDAELLKTDDPFDPNHPKFSNSKFWGPATSFGNILQYGYKMKWHNLGPGNVQLRLCVVIAATVLEGIMAQRTFLCTSYVKDDKTDKREMARLKIKIQKIIDGTYVYRGNL